MAILYLQILVRLYKISFFRSCGIFLHQTTRLGIGVGGTFDFWTGKQFRAPIFIQRIGMEWLFRLILQPRRRFKRTFNYVVVFSSCVLEQLSKRNFVSCRFLFVITCVHLKEASLASQTLYNEALIFSEALSYKLK